MCLCFHLLDSEFDKYLEFLAKKKRSDSQTKSPSCCTNSWSTTGFKKNLFNCLSLSLFFYPLFCSFLSIQIFSQVHGSRNCVLVQIFIVSVIYINLYIYVYTFFQRQQVSHQVVAQSALGSSHIQQQQMMRPLTYVKHKLLQSRVRIALVGKCGGIQALVKKNTFLFVLVV